MVDSWVLRFAWVEAEDWQSLRDQLRFNGVKPVLDAWPAVKLLVDSGEGEPLLRGLRSGALDMEFVRIPAGTFTMGSPEDEEGRWEDEGPAHQVTVSEFSIGKYEVTNEQYRSVDPDHQGEDELPVTGVSWHEAKAFCEQFGYRLPTEAEWEFAARAGTQTRWSLGDDEGDLGRYGWYRANSGIEPHPVGMLEPNPWGLHDMHGNIYEWVEDWYGPYSADAQMDPTGPATGNRPIVRGGSFADTPRYLRSALRVRVVPGLRDRLIGFRCARSPRRQP